MQNDDRPQRMKYQGTAIAWTTIVPTVMTMSTGGIYRTWHRFLCGVGWCGDCLLSILSENSRPDRQRERGLRGIPHAMRNFGGFGPVITLLLFTAQRLVGKRRSTTLVSRARDPR